MVYLAAVLARWCSSGIVQRPSSGKEASELSTLPRAGGTRSLMSSRSLPLRLRLHLWRFICGRIRISAGQDPPLAKTQPAGTRRGSLCPTLPSTSSPDLQSVAPVMRLYRQGTLLIEIR